MLCIGVIGSDGWGWAGNEQGEGASRQSAGSSCKVLVQGPGWGEGRVMLPGRSKKVGTLG